MIPVPKPLISDGPWALCGAVLASQPVENPGLTLGSDCLLIYEEHDPIANTGYLTGALVRHGEVLRSFLFLYLKIFVSFGSLLLAWPSLVVASGLLIAGASRCGAWALGYVGSVAGAHRLSCPVRWKWLDCIWLFVTPWTVAHRAPLSMEFSR